MSEVKLVKLVNGEQIIGAITVTEAGYEVKKPIVIQAHPQGLLMRPWLLGSDYETPISLRREHVIVTTDVDKDLAQEYNEKYGSGIAVATPQQTAAVRKSKIIQ